MLVGDQVDIQRHQTLMSHRLGFTSFKAKRPIPYVQRWHRDVLVQLTLDPIALRIEPGPGTEMSEIFDLLVTTAKGVVRLFAIRDNMITPKLSAAGNCVSLLRSDVLKEPRAANARAIWSMRKKVVSPADRLRILIRLKSYPNGLPIFDLLDCVLGSPTEPAEAILALACEGLVCLSLDGPLVPETTVRLYPQAHRTDSGA